jgi:hypothetical protein
MFEIRFPIFEAFFENRGYASASYKFNSDFLSNPRWEMFNFTYYSSTEAKI